MRFNGLIASCGLGLLLVGGTIQTADASQRADRIMIEKGVRHLTLFDGKQVLKTYRIALGRNPVGPKMRQGDSRTPGGRYRIDRRNSASHYHKSLHVSYPSPGDAARARALGVSPGGDIMIHGQPNGWDGVISTDWTDGCIAVSNDEIEEIWRLVSEGTPVEIVP